MGAAARLAGRRRLSAALGLARTIPNTMIVASDQGAIITRNAHDRRSARRDVELVAQSADGADLSPLGRLPLSVLGDRRAAGQRRRRGALARQVRRDLDARLGADRRRRRERHHRGRSAASRHRLRRHRRSAATSRLNAPLPTRPRRSAPSRPRDATGRSRSCSRRPIRTRSTTRISSSSRRPTARRPGRRSAPTSRVPIPAFRRISTPPRRADTDRNGKRGVIYTIAPSPLHAPMIWIGTDDGLIQLTTDDGKTWQNVTPPALTPWSRVTDDRSVALRRERRRTRASIAISSRTSSRTSIARATAARRWQKITRGLPAGVLRARRQGRSGAARTAVRGHRARRVRVVRRRRQLAVAAAQPAGDVGARFRVYGNDLIVGTHGRGFWVIDDISPLRQVERRDRTRRRVPVQAGRRDHHDQGGDNGTPTAERRAAGAESRRTARRSTTT